MAYHLHKQHTTQAFQDEAELMSRDALESVQGGLLAQTVQRAKRSSLYASRLSAVPDAAIFLSPRDFQAYVPLTTKEELRVAGRAAWLTDADAQAALVLGTSGTTGARIALPYTHEDLQRWAVLMARTLRVNGFRAEDVVVLPAPLGLFTGGHGMFNGLRRLGCTVIPTGPLHAPQLCDILRGDLGVTPTAIVSLPTHMLRLLDTLPSLGVDPRAFALRIGSFGAEAWSETARARIEEGFGLRAMDSYGIGELCGPGIAGECDYRAGLHVWEDAFFVEIIDPQTGQPAPDGAMGELVLTSLFRAAFPVLRYRTGDAAAIIAGTCACGRAHRRITRIPRRLDDTLVITGVNIDAADIETMLYRFPWVGHEFYLEAAGAHGDALLLHVERKMDVAMPADGQQQIADAIRRAYPVRLEIRIYEGGQLARVPGKAQRIRG